MNRAREIAGRLALASVSLAMALLIAELFLRIAPPRAYPADEQKEYTVFDPRLGWKNRPGAATIYERPEYRTRVEMNSLGFRDIERAPQTPADRPRVLVLGDSFVEAYSVERDESFTRRLESMRAARGCPVDVVNAGVHGYSTDQEALWYLDSGRSLRPAIVVLAVYYNDIIHNVRDRYSGAAKPVLEMRDGVLVPVNAPLPGPEPESPHPPLATPGATAPRGLRLPAFVLGRLQESSPAAYDRAAGLLGWPPREPGEVSDEFKAYRPHTASGEIEAAWDRTREIVTALASDLYRDGRRLIVLHVPGRVEVDPAAFARTLETYRLNPAAWEAGAVSRRLREIAAQAGAAFVDPGPALAALSGDHGYFPRDGHWNRRGHEAIARVLDNALSGDGVTCAKIAR